MMANKQIIDYSAGTFAPTDVLLKQPAAGGIYKKVNLLSLLGFKMWIARGLQSGTAAPTWTELYNTLGGSPAWTRAAAGKYIGTLAGAFPQLQVLPFCFTEPFDTNRGISVTANDDPILPNGEIIVQTFDGGNKVDDILNDNINSIVMAIVIP